MGCCSSSASQVTPQNQPLAKPQEPVRSDERNLVDQNNNKSTTQTTNADDGELRASQFDTNDLDRQSLGSVRTGKSLIFPDQKDFEPVTKDDSDDSEFRASQADINDFDRQSLGSVRTGKSPIFPDQKDLEPVTKDDGEFRVRQFDINDLDSQSLDSVRTGDSLIFPDHKDVEVRTCTPPRKEAFVKMEDTFWWKKRQLIPDYSVMEKIDKHVLAVGSCSF